MATAAPVTATSILESVLGDATTMRPNLDEQDAQLPRYVFNPFRTRRLRPYDMGMFGITALHQGIIQPFHPFDKPETDFDEVMRIQAGDLTAGQGVNSWKLFRRNPKKVVAAVVKLFGGLGETPTGVMEIEALRGHDGNLLRQLQSTLLPEIYTTAEAQIQQLQSVNLLGKPPLFEAVRDALILSTSLSVTWAEAHHRGLILGMQAAADKGGKRMSKLDFAVCAWLNYPVPQVQSKLVQNQAQAQAVTAPQIIKPTIQCESCGHESNLLANGNPPKFCGVCREAFVAAELPPTDSEILVVTPNSISFDPENPMDEADPDVVTNARLAADQARMREKLKSQRK